MPIFSFNVSVSLSSFGLLAEEIVIDVCELVAFKVSVGRFMNLQYFRNFEHLDQNQIVSQNH